MASGLWHLRRPLAVSGLGPFFVLTGLADPEREEVTSRVTSLAGSWPPDQVPGRLSAKQIPRGRA